jgi:hypothetical protein
VTTEDEPLDPSPPAAQARSLAAIRHLEETVLESPLEGVVLRYGSLYGPGSSGPARRGRARATAADRRRRRRRLVVAARGRAWPTWREGFRRGLAEPSPLAEAA